MVAQKTTTPVINNKETFWELHKLEQRGSSAFVLDAYEADNVIELTAEVPGVQDSDIDVHLEGDILTISVDKRAQSEGKRMHFSERSYGQFQRSIQVPFVPNADSVTAQVENGVLVIRFPRVESDRTRRIAIGRARPGTGQERRAIGATWEQTPATDDALTLTDAPEAAPSDSAVEDTLTLTDVAGAAPRKSAAEKHKTLTPRDWLEAEQT